MIFLRAKQRFWESAVSFHLGEKTFTKNPQHSITFMFHSIAHPMRVLPKMHGDGRFWRGQHRMGPWSVPRREAYASPGLTGAPS
jgi:hypothetical protein